MADISLPVRRPSRWSVPYRLLLLCILTLLLAMNWSRMQALTEQADNCNTRLGRLVDTVKPHLGMSSQCCFGAILLEDGHSFLLQEDGHSKICLE